MSEIIPYVMQTYLAKNLMTALLHFLVSCLDGRVYHWCGSPVQKPNNWW